MIVAVLIPGGHVVPCHPPLPFTVTCVNLRCARLGEFITICHLDFSGGLTITDIHLLCERCLWPLAHVAVESCPS